ncbi:unnamed protein product [Cladocopium goreaui]|uniref:Protein xylosyltransferase (Peptid e O-xylosyltransferase) n=1 Tax=Cladocopium goreaui TaxID=2562237 RepID=A0A9P1DG29_9DINO|nr:unnamed protein product [Cladocopium goreaui]
MSDKSARAVQFPTGSSRDTPPSTEEAACRGARALPEVRFMDSLALRRWEMDSMSSWMLQFLLAITLAAVSISFLTSTGIISRCPICASAEYGACAAAQDFKVLASFFLGVVCCKTSDLGSTRRRLTCDSSDGCLHCWLLW